MSGDAAETHADRGTGAAARARRGRHPSPKEYVRVAAVLAVVTGLEVAVYYLQAVRDFLIPMLFLFSLIKFSLVVLWFMHLRFDSRVYARFFAMGLAFAITLYVIVLLTFGVFAR